MSMMSAEEVLNMFSDGAVLKNAFKVEISKGYDCWSVRIVYQDFTDKFICFDRFFNDWKIFLQLKNILKEKGFDYVENYMGCRKFKRKDVVL